LPPPATTVGGDERWAAASDSAVVGGILQKCEPFFFDAQKCEPGVARIRRPFYLAVVVYSDMCAPMCRSREFIIDFCHARAKAK
jgi:hypothetical protein